MPKHIALLSDSTGDLGERMIRALISQFPSGSFTFRVYRFIATLQDLKKILASLSKDRPTLFHTVIHPDFKKAILAFSKKHKLNGFDMTGKAMEFLEKSSGLKSKPDLKNLHELNQEYERRIAALSFTVGHDDGLNPVTISEADIVLLGVSRTSKTPTSIYLANRGYKVANIPLVPGNVLPDTLKKILRRHVVGLTVDPEKLREIRLRRSQEEKIPVSDYSDLRKISQELSSAEQLFSELKCPVIDVTHRAVEETAALVLKLLDLH